MPSDRGTAGETFNNTYRNDTLVGNWLEDRLQRPSAPPANGQPGVPGGVKGGHGLLEDPRITLVGNAPQLRHDLMHSTYDVEYSRKGGRRLHRRTNGVDGAEESGKAVGEEDVDMPPARSVLLATAATLRAGGAGGGGSWIGKDGLSRPLLFSQDPVTDPEADLPISTNTDTYGAFYGAPALEGARGQSTSPTQQQQQQQQRGRGEAQGKELNLYHSVTSARARQPGMGTTKGGTSGLGAAGGTLLALSGRGAGTAGFASLAVPAAGGAGADFATTDANRSGPRRRAGGGGRGGSSKEEEEEEDMACGGGRWCTSKLAADVPVEHYAFQRRLPPVWM